MRTIWKNRSVMVNRLKWSLVNICYKKRKHYEPLVRERRGPQRPGQVLLPITTNSSMVILRKKEGVIVRMCHLMAAGGERRESLINHRAVENSNLSMS